MLLWACLAGIALAAVFVLLMACLSVGSNADDEADLLLARLKRRSASPPEPAIDLARTKVAA